MHKFSAATACVIQFSTGKRIFYVGFQSVACVALVSRITIIFEILRSSKDK